MKHQAPGSAEVDQALRKRARSSPRAGSVLVWIVAALQRLGGRRPCRCFRARPCRMVPPLLAAVALVVGCRRAGLARGVIGPEPAAEEACSLGLAACTCA